MSETSRLAPTDKITTAVARLAAAVEARVTDIASLMSERWKRIMPGAYETTDETQLTSDETQLAQFCYDGSSQICRFLTTGEAMASTGSTESTASRVLDDGMKLSDSLKLFLTWRDCMIDVFRQEAERLESPPEALRQAEGAARRSCDASLVNVAKVFFLRRAELQTQLTEEQGRLTHQALHDALTGLPNRVLFLERLAQSIEMATRRSIHSAVLFIDIDRFKAVNDMAGHAVGDQLLIGVARRLRDMLRPGDSVARLGGDEFVVLCENLFDVQKEAVAIAQRICEIMARPFGASGTELFTSASVGIAFVRPGDDPHVLVSRADSAMYMAKLRGRSRWEIYHPDFDERTTRRAELINGLHRAVERDELVLHYQPVKDLSTGAVVSMEALARWEHPSLGLVAPTEFIPLAEETGLIVEVGRWVLREAATACARWRAEGHPTVDVAVNVSGRQLEDPGFCADVERALNAAGLPASALSMEVTESVIVAEGSLGHETLEGLQRLGVRLAIDDFGIGYSSLSYLAKLPVHSLKVDRTFIAGLGTAQDGSIVTAMVDLAHKLGLAVVAEGVETETELAELKAAHCDEAQGFLLGRPAPIEELAEWRADE